MPDARQNVAATLGNLMIQVIELQGVIVDLQGKLAEQEKQIAQLAKGDQAPKPEG